MRLPEDPALKGLSDADRFRFVMRRLVTVTPEQLAERQRQQEADPANKKKGDPEDLPRNRPSR